MKSIFAGLQIHSEAFTNVEMDACFQPQMYEDRMHMGDNLNATDCDTASMVDSESIPQKV